MTTYSSPRESGLAKAAVDALAARVAQQLGYAPGAPLEPIVAKLGGKVLVQSDLKLGDDSLGSIRIRSAGDFDIFVAQHTGMIRDRFTIAHEIGHYVLHYLYFKEVKGEEPGPTEVKRYGSGRIEWEANWFAAGFLMPATDFRAAVERMGANADRLADQFKVSAESARIRLSTLRLV